MFSTGDYIDSLSIKGQVKDAFTDEPIPEMIVMLYIDDRDSIPFLQRPFYFAQSDENGNFSINNLRADTFKIVVIEDLNLSYTYNPESERIGFLETPYILTDSSSQEIELQLFKEGGSGLGLAIVKHIVDAHDEKIYVESQHGIGSEFSFTMEKAK